MHEGIEIAPHILLEVLEIVSDFYLKWVEYACYLQIEGRITIPLAVKLLLFVL